MNRVEALSKLSKEGASIKANCWGATVLYFGGLNYPKWLVESELERFLEDNTCSVLKLKLNCIYAMYQDGDIIHTAIYVGNGQFWHKPGQGAAEFTDANGLYLIYPETTAIKLFQVMPKVKPLYRLNRKHLVVNWLKNFWWKMSGSHIPSSDLAFYSAPERLVNHSKFLLNQTFPRLKLSVTSFSAPLKNACMY